MSSTSSQRKFLLVRPFSYLIPCSARLPLTCSRYSALASRRSWHSDCAPWQVEQMFIISSPSVCWASAKVRAFNASASSWLCSAMTPAPQQAARSSSINSMSSSAIGWAILLATTLNFLGFGVMLPTPDWGADLAAGKDWLQLAWWIATFPGLAITALILASNYLGDQVAAAFDPQSHWRNHVQRVGVEV